jgi:hypothetical protein
VAKKHKGENMFETMFNPVEFYKNFSDSFTKFPKSETEMKEFLNKLKNVFETEYKNSKVMWETYQKAMTGDATVNEIALANKKLKAALTTARLGFILALPGAIFILPAIVKIAKEYDIDIIPQSVYKEFNL